MCNVHPLEVEKPAIFGCAQSGCQECLEALMQRHEGLVHYVLQRQKRCCISMRSEGWPSRAMRVWRLSGGCG